MAEQPVTTNARVVADVDRRRSGYTRHFNVFDVFVFNVLGFSLGLALSTNPPFIGAFAPSANILLVLAIAAVLALLNGLVYGWFGGMMPSTGGDYVFVSRSLGNQLGFIASWGFTASQVYGLTISIGWILSVAIAPALQTLGVSVASPAVAHVGANVGKPGSVLIGTLVLLAFYLLLAYRAVSTRRYIIYPLFAVGLLGPVLMVGILATHSHAEFVAAFNAFVQKLTGTPDAYSAVIATARGGGMTIAAEKTWPASLQAVPLGFLCFVGFTYSVYAGGEIVDTSRSQTRGILAALGFGALVFMLAMGLYVHVVGAEFHSAIGFPAATARLGLSANSLNLTVGALAPSPGINLLMQVGNLVWFVMGPYIVLEVCIHNLIAWRDDHLMPERLGKRGGKRNAPWVAALWVCLFTALWAILNYVSGFTLVGYVALASVPFLLTAIGAVYFPRVNPDAFKRAPPGVRRPLFGATVFQVVGALSAAGFFGVLYACVWYPEISGGTRTMTLAYLVGVYALGFIIYEINRDKYKQRAQAVGIDIEALFRQIPND